MLGAAQQWQVLIALLVNVGVGGVVAWAIWSARRQFVDRQEFEARARAVEVWQARAEERLAGIPTPQQLTEIAVNLAVTSERLAGVVGIVDRVERTVARQEDFMRKHM